MCSERSERSGKRADLAIWLAQQSGQSGGSSDLVDLAKHIPSHLIPYLILYLVLYKILFRVVRKKRPFATLVDALPPSPPQLQCWANMDLSRYSCKSGRFFRNVFTLDFGTTLNQGGAGGGTGNVIRTYERGVFFARPGPPLIDKE